MKPAWRSTMSAVLFLLVAAAGSAQTNPPAASAGGTGAAEPQQTKQARALPVASKRWTGDFEAMLERRMIRVYVPRSRSLYFIDKGRERGIAPS